jgi:O-antigen/teichoic acid export membrane protein
MITRLRAHAAQPMIRGALGLMTSNTLSTVLGMVFWIVAARLYASSTVGRDAALVVGMVTVSSVAQLNLYNGLLRFLPALRGTARGSLVRAYAATTALSVVLAGAFALLVPSLAPQLDVLRHDPLTAAAFVAGTAGWTIFTLQDAALTVLRRPAWLVAENVSFGVARLAVLGTAAALHFRDGPLVAWLIPMAILVLPVNLAIFRRALPAHVALPAPAGASPRRRALAFMGLDYAASLLSQATLIALPIAIVAFSGTARYAHFAIAFTIVTAFDLVIFDATAALTVEGAFASSRLRALALTTIRTFGGPLLLGTAVLLAAGALILAPFGGSYVRDGLDVLRLLAATCVFRAALALGAALMRVKGQGLRLLLTQAAVNGLTVGLALVWGPRMGPSGVALAWLVAHAAIAVPMMAWIVAQLHPLRRGARALAVKPST